VITRACLGCGVLITGGRSRCVNCRPKRNVKARGGGAQITRFRATVMAIAHHQCEAIENGVRCTERDPAELEAHHLKPISEGGSNDPVTNGVLLCKDHHARLEGRELRQR
jgi:hypothetical protein